MATEEKTEQATPRRRLKAREEGQVAQSKELSGALALAAVVLVYRLGGGSISGRIAQAVEAQFASLGSVSFTGEALAAQAAAWLGLIAASVMPVALTALVIGSTAGLVQTGFLFAPKRISPRADKLNPLEGLKRIFSLSGLVEAAKGSLKVIIVAFIAYQVYNSHKIELLSYQQMELAQTLGCVSDIIFEFAIKYCAGLLVIGAGDYGYQRWQHEKQLRMSRYELQREMRESEGDPHIRAHRQQRRRALLQQGITAEFSQAQVVVINPTHVAVALMYQAGQMDAPVVVAKGRGAVAARIRELAATYGIPIVHEPAVARALYDAVPLGRPVPPVLYQAVAEILASIYRAAAERQARRLARLRAGR